MNLLLILILHLIFSILEAVTFLDNQMAEKPSRDNLPEYAGITDFVQADITFPSSSCSQCCLLYG